MSRCKLPNLSSKSISNKSSIVTKFINFMTQSSDGTQSRMAWPASQAIKHNKTHQGQLLKSQEPTTTW